MVLPPAEGELGLQEQLVSRHQTAADRSPNSAADRRLVVMSALVGGVDASKSLPEGQRGQTLGVVLLPGGAIEEAGHSNVVDHQVPLIH